MAEDLKVGLVLSGGGTKGAYQVGVVKALHESGTQIDVIAGASIGALNGGVLASASSLADGVARLEKLWGTLANSSPLSLNISNYLMLLCSAGLAIQGKAAVDVLSKFVSVVSQKFGIHIPAQLNGFLDSGILCDQRIQALMDEYFDTNALANGMPLYVSAYKSMGGVVDLTSVLASEFGVRDTPDSHFLHVQSLPVSAQREALLASAAIPVLFAAKLVNGDRFTDGGQGGWQKMQGNTPVTPLVQIGCNLIIVTHLGDGSLWSRDDFPDVTIMEIRPQSRIARDSGFVGSAKDLLGFDSSKIFSWMEQGYHDTKHCIERIMKPLAARHELRVSESAVKASEARNAIADATLKNAMSILQS